MVLFLPVNSLIVHGKTLNTILSNALQLKNNANADFLRRLRDRILAICLTNDYHGLGTLVICILLDGEESQH
jgi:hypothetical protein